MNFIVAMPFDERLAETIGKRGSENSMAFYNRKQEGNTIVALMPSSIDDKFYALPQSLLIADQIILSTANIDRLFGEAIIACSLLGKRVIFTKDSDISKLTKGMSLPDAQYTDRNDILNAITSFRQEGGASEEARVDIDRAFNVKGIGTVILGVVGRGTVKVHDSLYHNSGKAASIRSIQSQDEDIKEAPKGTRVGLAIKGMEDSEMSKGDTLSTKQIKKAKALRIEMQKSPFASEEMEKGKSYSIAVGFSYSVCFVEEMEGNSARLRLEKQMPVEPNDVFLLVRNNPPRIFASGKVISVE